jgi:regulator of replication initiation timing
VSPNLVVTPTYSELVHELRKLRAENDGLRFALDERVQRLGEDAEAAERAQSRIWFHAWRESQRQLRMLREEIARMKEGGRG